MTCEQRKFFLGLFVINFLISFGFGISDAFFPLYCQSIGARGMLLGAVMGGYALSKIIFSPLMGAFIDRLGRKQVVICSLILYLLVSLLYLMTSSLWLVVFLRLVQGMSCAMFRPVVQALVADHAPPGERGKVMGTFDVSFYTALTLGPVLGGLIVEYWQFRGLFICLVICCFAALSLAFVTVSAQFSGKAGDENAKKRKTETVWKAALRRGTFGGILVFIFGRGCGITACATFLPILLSSQLGLSGLQIGIVMASTTFVIPLLLRPAGQIADRVSRKRLVISGGMTVPMLYMLLPVAADFGQVLGICLGIGAFSALSQPAVTALLAEEGQQIGLGVTMGSFHASLNLGFVAGPLLGALAQLAMGLHGVFIFIGLIGFLSALGFAVTAFRHNQYEIAG